MTGSLDRAAAGGAHLEVATGELDVRPAGRHPDNLLLGGGGDLPLTRRHRHILLRIDLRIVVLGLNEHLAVMGNRFESFLVREHRDAFASIDVEALPGRLLQMLLGDGIDVLAGVADEAFGVVALILAGAVMPMIGLRL